MMVQDSNYTVVKNALPEKKASQEWEVRAVVDVMEEKLQQKEMMGMVQHLRQVLSE